MVATLYKQRNNLYKQIEHITAEPNWKDVISEWLLSDVIRMPTGIYIITQDDVIATFKLEIMKDGTRFLALQSHIDLNNILNNEEV